MRKKVIPEGYVMIQPGEEIPEAQFWPNVDAHLSQRFITRTGEGKFIALKEQMIKRTPEKPKEEAPEKPVVEKLEAPKKPKVKKPKAVKKVAVVEDFDEELD